MPKLMKASEVRIQKTFRIKQETLNVIERIRKEEGLSQGKIIDLAIELLERVENPMEKIKFICEGCKKEIDVQSDIYEKVYEGEKYCLSCRPKRK